MEEDSNLTRGKDVEGCSGNGKLNDDKEGEHRSEALESEDIGPPAVGMVFTSEEDVRDYYSKYAQHKGFGIYRRSSRCGVDGKVKYFTLACANAGKVRTTNANKKFPVRQSAKTNCMAKINVAVESDTRVYVCHVVLEHNHELSPGKVQQNIRKKVWSPRLQRKRQKKEQIGIKSCNPPHSNIGGYENLGSVGGVCLTTQSANGVNHLPHHATGLSVGENTFHYLNRSSASGVYQDFQDALSSALAKRAVGLVKSGMVIGLGTGCILSLLIGELGKLIKEGKLKDVVAVGTNYQTRRVARQFGVTTVDLNDVSGIDISFDIVDEVDFNKNILKVSGANHTVQKVVYSMTDMCIILADHTKVVHRLGSKFPVAVEVLPIAVTPVLRRLITLGGVPEVRSALGKDGPVITDFGNMIIDVSFPNGIQNPADLEKNINLIPGVVDNGVVSGVATTVLVAVRNGNDVNVVNLEEFAQDMVVRRYTNPVL